LFEVITGGGKNVVLEANCKEPIMDLFNFQAQLKLVYPEHQMPLVDLDLK